MNWTLLTDIAQLVILKEKSFIQPQVIFKHSTRCSISSMVKNRLDKSEPPHHIPFHFLDLIRHRNVSDKIAEEFLVEHESPQILVIKNGECIYDESHTGISMDDIVDKAG